MTGADSSPWDTLEAQLTTSESLESLIASLRERYGDPVPVCTRMLTALMVRIDVDPDLPVLLYERPVPHRDAEQCS